MKQRIRRALSGLLCFSIFCIGAAFAQQVTPPMPPMGMGGGGASPPQSLETAAAIVEVGDVIGFLEAAGGIAEAVAPGMNAMTLKMMLGSQLGDPNLEGLPAGSRLVAVIYPTQQKVLFLNVTEDRRSSYTQVLQNRGKMVEEVSGLLAVGENAADLAVAKAIGAEVKKQYFSGKGKASLKTTVFLGRILKQFDAMIQMMMPMLTMQIQQQAAQGTISQEMARMQEAQIRAIYNVAKQIDLFHIELMAPAQGVLLDFQLTPYAGTNLAEFLSAKASDSRDLISLLPAEGAMRLQTSINMTAYSALLRNEMDKALVQMGVPDADKASVLELIESSTAMSSDNQAVSMIVPGKGLISGSFVMESKNPDKVLDQIEEVMKMYQSKIMKEIQQSAGVKQQIGITRDVRKHNGISIHRMSFKQEMTGDNPQLDNIMKLFAQIDGDMAVVDGLLVVSLGGGEGVESLIDAVKAGKHPASKPLQAVTDFGKDGVQYVDLDLAALAQALAKFSEQLPEVGLGSALNDQTLATLQGAPPMTIALFIHEGRGRLGILIPRDLIGKAAQAAQMIMMQRMMAGMQAGGGQPVAGSSGAPVVVPAGN